jgi:hypothetical protein
LPQKSTNLNLLTEITNTELDYFKNQSRQAIILEFFVTAPVCKPSISSKEAQKIIEQDFVIHAELFVEKNKLFFFSFKRCCRNK